MDPKIINPGHILYRGAATSLQHNDLLSVDLDCNAITIHRTTDASPESLRFDAINDNKLLLIGGATRLTKDSALQMAFGLCRLLGFAFEIKRHDDRMLTIRLVKPS